VEGGESILIQGGAGGQPQLLSQFDVQSIAQMLTAGMSCPLLYTLFAAHRFLHLSLTL
jgi:hypothetical protein